MFMQNKDSFAECEKISVSGAVFSGAAGRVCTGLVAGTKVETPSGWRPVETIVIGERVQTYDGGLKKVLRIERTYFGAELATTYPDGLLLVPGGALDNCEAFYLLPDQHLLIDSDDADKILGTPVALAPATALEGYRGIMRVMPVDVIEVVTLIFDAEEIVYANTGTMLHCPAKSAPGRTHHADVRSEFFAVLEHERACEYFALRQAGMIRPDGVARALPALDRAA